MRGFARPAALAGLLACTLVASALAANRDGEVVSFTEDCGASGCRTGGTILKIRGRDGQDYAIPVAHSPYVMPDGTIVIFPGEKLMFAVADGDMPGIPHLLADGAAAGPGMVTLSLDYQASGAMMLLGISNGGSRTLKLDLYLGSPRDESWLLHYTSSCAVMPGLFDDESWPAPLGPIFLSNIRYLPGSGAPGSGASTVTISCD